MGDGGSQLGAMGRASPVRRGETDGYRKAHRAVVANMHQRVRDRLPHLPTLVRMVDEHRADQAALLATAAATPVGDTFSHQARGFRRVAPVSYDTPEYRGATPPVLVEDLATGERINFCDTEDEAFWAWAIVETLRHTGVRVEELTELTHLALISYQLPDTSEIVPMLQIIPSKANQERLLLVGAELANVLASIITRLHTQNGGTIPLTARYDGYERSTRLGVAAPVPTPPRQLAMECHRRDHRAQAAHRRARPRRPARQRRPAVALHRPRLP